MAFVIIAKLKGGPDHEVLINECVIGFNHLAMKLFEKRCLHIELVPSIILFLMQLHRLLNVGLLFRYCLHASLNGVLGFGNFDLCLSDLDLGLTDFDLPDNQNASRKDGNPSDGSFARPPVAIEKHLIKNG